VSALEAVLPGSSIMPGRIFEAAKKLGVDVEFIAIQRWEEQEAGKEAYSQLELFDRLFADVPIPSSNLIFIPDCALPTHALAYSGNDLRGAIGSLKDIIFDSDAVFLWPESNRISVFHHSGGFFHVRLPPPDRLTPR